MTGCTSETTNTNNEEPSPSESQESGEANEKQEYEKLQGVLELDKTSAPVLTDVTITATGLNPNEEAKVIWNTVDGTYELKNIYQFVKTAYTPTQVELATGTTDENGVFKTHITIPEDFGGDHDLEVYQNDKLVAKANFFVKSTFTIDSESGPVGSWITIKGQGIGWKQYGSLWHVNYDNKYTGMITAVSTNGTAEAKFRAAGPVGPHTITVESGAFGMPYINREQSPHSYIETQRFTYTVTSDEAKDLTYVADVPELAANGGAKFPEPVNAEGVAINLSKELGIVDEKIDLTAEGLPENSDITFVWNTMVGNRVTEAGFSEKQTELGVESTNENGELQFTFAVPDDLGGPPHRIDLMANNEVIGQTYFKIIPSIVSISPTSGPVGTEITIEVKGVGWTEYDNIYNIVYDNAYLGYVCGFNSQGNVTFKLAASGQPGHHIIDLYPGIYKGEQALPEMFRRPQLTYEQDHPGSRIPSIHFGFEVTE